MPSVHSVPDYREQYFEYKELTKIHGAPTLDLIVQVYKQLKRNAQCLPTTLGGRQLGYLALILKTTTYATIAGATAFIRPTDPGPFTLFANPTPPATRAVPNPIPTLLTHSNITTNYRKAGSEVKKSIDREAKTIAEELTL